METVKNIVTTVVLLPVYTCLVLLHYIHIYHIMCHPDTIARRKSNTPEEINKRRQTVDIIINKDKTNYFIKRRLLFITHEERVWSKPSLCTSSAERTVKIRNLHILN